jgi:membrane-associated phospholipid phosphatase
MGDVHPSRFLWTAAAAVGVFFATYVLFVRTATGQQLENLALLGARGEFRDLRADSLTELHEITALSFALAVGLVVLVALLRRKPVLALTAGTVMAGSVAISELAKQLLARPELTEAPLHWLSNSFPSGHVTVAMAIGFGVVLVVPPMLRAVATVVASLYAMSIGQAVEIAGWHRLSDVVGAAVLVLAVASVALYLLARSGRMRPFTQPRRIGFTVVLLLLGGISLVLGGAGLALGLGQLVPVPEHPSQDELRLAYTTSLVLGVAVIGLVFLVLLWLIRPFAIDEDPGG